MPALRASKVVAAISPPASVVSSPTIAFCTAFASNKSTTRSNIVIWPISRMPVIRRPTRIAR